MKRSATLFFVICGLVCVAAAVAEEVTISTFHPSPSGNYKNLDSTQDAHFATSSGAVAVGSSNNPNAALVKLDVNGSIRVGVTDNSITCDNARVGIIRYNGGIFQGCNGNSWVNFGVYN